MTSGKKMSKNGILTLLGILFFHFTGSRQPAQHVGPPEITYLLQWSLMKVVRRVMWNC